MKIGGRVRLSDQRPISKQEFDTACNICEKTRKLVEQRSSYVEKHGLDPEIALPAANWAEGARDNDFYDAYRFVVTPKYDVINRLRFYTQTFTGYQLMSFSSGRGKRSVNPVPDNFDEKMEELLPSPPSWVYDYIALARYRPTEIIARPPKFLGEIGWGVDGSPVNVDTCAYQECLNLIYEAGIIDRLRKRVKESGSVSILEIGAGYGGLAYYLKHIIPQTNYYICDIPEALLFCTLYLALACPEYGYTIYDGTDKSVLQESHFGFKFIPNFAFDDLVTANIKIDLALNTASFSEMSEKQVRYYGQDLNYMLGDTGILFEQNKDEKPYCHNSCKLLLPKYFKSRRTIEPESFGGSTKGPADIWANRQISDLLRPGLKRHILRSIRHLRAGGGRFFATKLIVGVNRLTPLVEFVRSKPHLRRFALRILNKLY